jgi:hypothetical protein
MMLFNMTLHVCRTHEIGCTSFDLAGNSRSNITVGHGVVGDEVGCRTWYSRPKLRKKRSIYSLPLLYIPHMLSPHTKRFGRYGSKTGTQGRGVVRVWQGKDDALVQMTTHSICRFSFGRNSMELRESWCWNIARL